MDNKNEPLVSVVIHSFDRFEYLLNAINSVENQTYKNLELLLINDESSQEDYYQHSFPSFVKKIDIKKVMIYQIGLVQDKRLLILVYENSSGKHIALLDDDDIWLP